MTIVSDTDEDTIIERIEDAASKTPFVVVDLEGSASMAVVYAISQADFVVIPTQGSQLDANGRDQPASGAKMHESLKVRGDDR
jgi:chromosome partitioning protein